MYRRTIGYKYIIDDLEMAHRKKTGKFWVDLYRQFAGTCYFNSKIEHGFALLFHTLNCVLIYLVFGRSDIALLTALLFAVNPVNTQASVWLSGRPYAFTTFLVLLGLCLKPLFPFAYAITYAWAINVILAPLLFLYVKPHLMILVLPVVFWLCHNNHKRTFKLRYGTSSPIMQKFKFRNLMLVFKTFAYYFKLCLFPMRLGMCHSYLHTFGLTKEDTDKWFKFDKYFFMGVVLMALVGIAITFGWGGAFGLFWFSLFILQWCNLLPITHPISERYAYLANIGMMYALSYLIMTTVGLPLAVAFFVFYAVRLWDYLPAYRDVIYYWKNNTETFEDVAMAYNQYGLGLAEYGNIGTAFDIWIKGVQYRKKDFRLNYNLSNMLLSTGKCGIAKQFIQAAEEALDHNLNRDFWQKNIDKMKDFCKKNGVDIGR